MRTLLSFLAAPRCDLSTGEMVDDLMAALFVVFLLAAAAGVFE